MNANPGTDMVWTFHRYGFSMQWESKSEGKTQLTVNVNTGEPWTLPQF